MRILSMLKNVYKIFKLAMQLRACTYFSETGYMKSFFKGVPVDANGLPVPWITYSAQDFLAARVEGLSLFEFGAGNSTLFFSRLCSSVVSVEHDGVWADFLSGIVPVNCSVLHRCGGNDYLHAIKGGVYDIVLIDGLLRNECVLVAVESLSPAGVIVFDDADRGVDYAAGFEALAAFGFRRIDFTGLAPGSLQRNVTAVFYRDNNVLGI